MLQLDKKKTQLEVQLDKKKYQVEVANKLIKTMKENEKAMTDEINRLKQEIDRLNKTMPSSDGGKTSASSKDMQRKLQQKQDGRLDMLQIANETLQAQCKVSTTRIPSRRLLTTETPARNVFEVPSGAHEFCAPLALTAG